MLAGHVHVDEVSTFKGVLEECAHRQALQHTRARLVHACRPATIADDHRVRRRDHTQRAVREARKVLPVEGHRLLHVPHRRVRSDRRHGKGQPGTLHQSFV